MQKFQIKTLKGDLFPIEAEESVTIGDLKTQIEQLNSELVADRQRLIYQGKVLKDTQTVGELKIAESEFIVCMVSKPKAEAPAPAAAAPAAAPSSSSSSVATPAAATTAAAAAAPVAPEGAFAYPDALAGLMAMGFPEAETKAALNAAMGNADMAYQFLENGIPESALRASAAARGAGHGASPSSGAAPSSSTGAVGINSLRSHPQFDMLRQMVQSNPAQLPQILQIIGNQQPELLAAIHANEGAFLAMMNEPIGSPAPAPAAPPAQPQQGMGAGLQGMGNPAGMIAALGALPPEQRAAFAQSMGISPEQLQQMIQLMASMPPQQLQQMLGAGLGQMGGMGGAPPPGAITLTQDELASVRRLQVREEKGKKERIAHAFSTHIHTHTHTRNTHTLTHTRTHTHPHIHAHSQHTGARLQRATSGASISGM